MDLDDMDHDAMDLDAVDHDAIDHDAMDHDAIDHDDKDPHNTSHDDKDSHNTSHDDKDPHNMSHEELLDLFFKDEEISDQNNTIDFDKEGMLSMLDQLSAAQHFNLYDTEAIFQLNAQYDWKGTENANVANTEVCLQEYEQHRLEDAQHFNLYDTETMFQLNAQYDWKGTENANVAITEVCLQKDEQHGLEDAQLLNLDDTEAISQLNAKYDWKDTENANVAITKVCLQKDEQHGLEDAQLLNLDDPKFAKQTPYFNLNNNEAAGQKVLSISRDELSVKNESNSYPVLRELLDSSKAADQNELLTPIDEESSKSIIVQQHPVLSKILSSPSKAVRPRSGHNKKP